MIAQQGKSPRIGAYANAIKYAKYKIILEKNMTLQEIDKKYEEWFERIGYAEHIKTKNDVKWSQVIADKDAEIARLKAELEKRK